MCKIDLQSLIPELESTYCNGAWEKYGLRTIPFLPVNIRLPHRKNQTLHVRNLRKDESIMYYEMILRNAKKEKGYIENEVLSLKLYLDVMMANCYCVVFESKDSKEILGITKTSILTDVEWPAGGCAISSMICPKNRGGGLGQATVYLNNMLMRDLDFNYVWLEILANNLAALGVASALGCENVGRLPLSGITSEGHDVDSVFFVKSLINTPCFRTMSLDIEGTYICPEEYIW